MTRTRDFPYSPLQNRPFSTSKQALYCYFHATNIINSYTRPHLYRNRTLFVAPQRTTPLTSSPAIDNPDNFLHIILRRLFFYHCRCRSMVLRLCPLLAWQRESNVIDTSGVDGYSLQNLQYDKNLLVTQISLRMISRLRYLQYVAKHVLYPSGSLSIHSGNTYIHTLLPRLPKTTETTERRYTARAMRSAGKPAMSLILYIQ